MCGPVGDGGEPGSSVQLKEAPGVFVSIVTLMSWLAGPVPFDGVQRRFRALRECFLFFAS